MVLDLIIKTLEFVALSGVCLALGFCLLPRILCLVAVIAVASVGALAWVVYAGLSFYEWLAKGGRR